LINDSHLIARACLIVIIGSKTDLTYIKANTIKCTKIGLKLCTVIAADLSIGVSWTDETPRFTADLINLNQWQGQIKGSRCGPRIK
jgi:hypothetical protein